MNNSLKPSKVLIIGSGPIVIGQAVEFNYAGTQACKAMREEEVTSVLVNSNPATIMTDDGIADSFCFAFWKAQEAVSQLPTEGTVLLHCVRTRPAIGR